MANDHNLRLLAEGLKKLPVNYSKFDMHSYASDNHGDELSPATVKTEISNCGTVACAMGHGPTFPGLEAAPYESWRAYGERVFGITAFDPEHDYMFGSEWKVLDNTIEGAIARIETYLEEGLPSEYEPC